MLFFTSRGDCALIQRAVQVMFHVLYAFCILLLAGLQLLP